MNSTFFHTNVCIFITEWSPLRGQLGFSQNSVGIRYSPKWYVCPHRTTGFVYFPTRNVLSAEAQLVVSPNKFSLATCADTNGLCCLGQDLFHGGLLLLSSTISLFESHNRAPAEYTESHFSSLMILRVYLLWMYPNGWTGRMLWKHCWHGIISHHRIGHSLLF